MLRLALSDCARVLGVAHAGADPVLEGVSIDTRTLAPGALYVAIRGPRHDGHDFVAAARAGGARAALVERPVDPALPQLLVADTRAALGALAGYWARRCAVPTVAITGSNGKTTVKEIVASILGQTGAVLATRGNLNNEIGVPLTLLGLEASHRHAVIEMGANRAGEIAYLAALAAPRVALVTNVGPAHLEGFGSVEGVAAAKAEIYGALGADGCAVVNADDAFADVFRAACARRTRIEFGRDAEVRELAPEDEGRLRAATPQGTIVAPFALAGRHNRANALAAVAVACALGVDARAIAAGLEAVRAAPGRLERKRAACGATLIDDSYNANPASARAALDVLAAARGRRHLVLGDMAELGEDARALHAELGVAARAAGVDALWTTGALAAAAQEAWRRAAGAPESATRHAGGGHFDDAAALAQTLATALDADATVLIKGSRAARMERVVAALEAGARP